jgi:bleomycin hydrolase
MDSVRKVAGEFAARPSRPELTFKLDFSTIDRPSSVSEFKTVWHNPPISQAISGMCWCFSATSFFESEVYRLSKREIKLSELHTVYWEYVEKARGFVRERGNSVFSQGSEADAVKRIWKKYGVVPATAYTGMRPGQKFHDHDRMFEEMNAYLMSVKTTNAWNEDAVVATIKTTLNHYLGEPPAMVSVDGKQMSPKDYLERIVRLKLDDYISLLSIMEKPYGEHVEHTVPDNWWHGSEYLNVPLDAYMKAIKNAARTGYNVCLGGDVSEAGYEGHAGVAIVPTFDIPPEYIDENARQFRYSNSTSVDDHGIHIVGMLQRNGVDWFLVKDSGSGSRNNDHPGYYFYHEDYVKLKMLDCMMHRDALKGIVELK